MISDGAVKNVVIAWVLADIMRWLHWFAKVLHSQLTPWHGLLAISISTMSVIMIFESKALALDRTEHTSVPCLPG
jgi:hypothetical protein